MYVYMKQNLPPYDSDGKGSAIEFQVGFFMPFKSGQPGIWMLESTWPTKEEAAARVNYLNGGISPELLARAVIEAPFIDVDVVQGFPK